VKRREFITLFGGAAAPALWPLAARAQQPAMPVVGFLRSTTAAGSAHLVGAFRQGLNEAGFVENQNVAIEYRWGDDQRDRLLGLVTELLHRRAAVIVANGAAAQAAKAATTTTPIVFVAGSDPVGIGLVASLSRPGGNITGLVFSTTDITAKRLGLLHELAPKAAVIAVLVDPNFPGSPAELRGVEEARRTIEPKIVVVKTTGEEEFNSVFAAIVRAGAGALFVGAGPFFNSRRRQIVAWASRQGLPASYVSRAHVEAGGLMSYGPSQTDAYRRAAGYVGRILKGEKAGDLPVELASKFDLIINLATAKAMGHEIPPTLLARADEVIE
jgi:putative ABC transport system substrate-binding protein